MDYSFACLFKRLPSTSWTEALMKGRRRNCGLKIWEVWIQMQIWGPHGKPIEFSGNLDFKILSPDTHVSWCCLLCWVLQSKFHCKPHTRVDRFRNLQVTFLNQSLWASTMRHLRIWMITSDHFNTSLFQTMTGYFDQEKFYRSICPPRFSFSQLVYQTPFKALTLKEDLPDWSRRNFILFIRNDKVLSWSVQRDLKADYLYDIHCV